MPHWYDKSGKSQFDVENAAAVKRGDKITTRPATLRDAKKHGWKPGWTAIGGILDKPALNKWKKGIFKGVIDEHLSKHDSETVGERNDRLVMETRAEFWRRIESETRHELEKYADLGTRVHATIQNFLKWDENKRLPDSGEGVENSCMKAFYEWFMRDVAEWTHSEQTFCSPEWGYGGTIDLEYLTKASQDAIVDFKTKQTKPGEKIVQYPENKWQLVAYALGIGKITSVPYTPPNWEESPPKQISPDRAGVPVSECPILGNLYLSTTEPGRWEYIQVPPEEIPELVLDVRDLTRLWNRMNGF